MTPGVLASDPSDPTMSFAPLLRRDDGKSTSTSMRWHDLRRPNGPCVVRPAS
jgi:hypothetical protein